MTNLTPTNDLFANRYGHSDVEPYEIVRIVSEKCIEVRAMDTSDNKTKMDFHVGGFSANCSNQNAQKYDYTSNPKNPVKKIRLNKVLVWKSKYGEKFSIAKNPYKFYDYNF
tara:strand:+ start:1550 stop:1882 length:333 start_codon:yes stop_codon:yes gene_type:complete